MGMILKTKVIGNNELRPAKFSFTDIRAEADLILQQARRDLDQARAQAETIIRQAEHEIQERRRQAEEQGYHSGYEKGCDEGRRVGSDQALAEGRGNFAQHTESLQESLHDVLRQIDHRRHELVSQCHQDLLAFSIAIAEKIVRKRVEVDPEAVLGNVKAAIDLVSARSAICVKMNSSDLETLNRLAPEWLTSISDLREISFVADESVAAGGCVLETAGGQIDAQIATQIDNIVKQFTPALSDDIKSWQGDSTWEEAPETDRKRPNRASRGDLRTSSSK